MTAIEDRVEHVLTETRMVLPGTQALLGFQFAAALTQAFASLPPSLRSLHLASSAAVALSAVLLMTPAAYHRIVENGEATARFHRLSSRLLLAAMAALALGMCGDVVVVVARATGRTDLALVVALGFLTLFGGLWFAVPLAIRRRGGAMR